MEEGVDKRRQAGEAQEPAVALIHPTPGSIAVHEGQAIGLGRVVIRRPGEVEDLELPAQHGSERDRKGQGADGHQGQALREEAELAKRAGFRVEPHRRRREVGKAADEQHDGNEVRGDQPPRGTRHRLQAPDDQRHQEAQPAAYEGIVEDRAHESPAGLDPGSGRQDRRAHGRARALSAQAVRSDRARSRLA
jgi:hypothetical protein